MQEYKVTFTCADCDNIDYYPINKYECAFNRTNNYNKKTCLKCNSNRYESLGFTIIKLDSELLDIWSKDLSLNFLDQDEELIIAEKEYIDLIFYFIDSDATLLYKKAVLLESLYVLIYDMHEGIKDEDELILNKIKEFLLSRIHLIDQFDYLIWDYIKEIVYVELGIKARMMKIKVCGMKIPENISQLSQLPINYMGLIFYPKSPRYIANLDPKVLEKLSAEINRVGVFVDEDIEVVLKLIEKYNLRYVQLHGKESVEYCSEISNRSKVKLIKAFNVATSNDFMQTEVYEDTCDFFLFDTKTSQYGGSGLKFDWSILDTYTGETPFFLSGGITIDDVKTIKMINHPKLQALDINSKFEIEPGLKDIEKLKKFINNIRL